MSVMALRWNVAGCGGMAVNVTSIGCLWIVAGGGAMAVNVTWGLVECGFVGCVAACENLIVVAVRTVADWRTHWPLVWLNAKIF